LSIVIAAIERGGTFILVPGTDCISDAEERSELRDCDSKFPVED